MRDGAVSDRRGCPVCGCPDRPWLRVKQVAYALNLTPDTVRRHIKRGRLEARKDSPGAPLQVRHASVHSFLHIQTRRTEDAE